MPTAGATRGYEVSDRNPLVIWITPLQVWSFARSATDLDPVYLIFNRGDLFGRFIWFSMEAIWDGSGF